MVEMSTPLPSLGFRDPAFLRSHAHSVLSFWATSPLPRSGGLYHCLRDNGSVYDKKTRHLVSSTRLIVEFAWAIIHELPPPPAPAPGWRAMLESCLQFLREFHFVPATGGYKWVVLVDDDGSAADDTATSEPTRNEATNEDATNRSYGLCFVLLAFSTALSAGVDSARVLIDEVTATLTEHFWEAEHGLYADEANADFSIVDAYRGQNANMHAVEAHMAAYKATHDNLHLERARTIARSMCVRQASLCDTATGCGALIYEHYLPDWSAPNLTYNKDKPNDRFRPWGFQPGHLAEWAKLLVQLDALGQQEADGSSPATWRLTTARRFFSAAICGWDEARGGGFVYSVAPTSGLPFCNAFKYKWVQTEVAASAALLARVSGLTDEERGFYEEWYDKVFALCWTHFVDHKRGSWYRVLNERLDAIDSFKCPPGKVDYHVTGLCFDAADAFAGTP